MALSPIDKAILPQKPKTESAEREDCIKKTQSHHIEKPQISVAKFIAPIKVNGILIKLKTNQRKIKRKIPFKAKGILHLNGRRFFCHGNSDFGFFPIDMLTLNTEMRWLRIYLDFAQRRS
ncbi:hypothetical protein AVEN_79545-1 [Araneus ventricosus]|uniref:Uncharacterized protein n=1 Tax=Araneus ventricosus TaxID=182803 RepID=A0A4Y2KP07_ARAVE|nr:hypothetical protein AVEN_79545-1 [Araneus ventricosus]